MITHDAVRELLKERKAADHIVKGGLEGLVDGWETTVKTAQKGYTHGLDEWRNEVDARNILAAAMEVAHPAQKKSMKLRLDAADAKFWKACESCDGSVWGAAQAEREKWTATKEWWYFLAPKKAGDELTSDLAKLAPRSGAKSAPANASKAAPAASKAALAASKAALAASKAAPSSSKDAPAVSKAAQSSSKAAQSSSKAAPSSSKAAPSSSKAAPAAAKAAPSTSKAAPVASQPAAAPNAAKKPATKSGGQP